MGGTGATPEVDMTVSTPAAPVAPIGELRQGLVATRRQYLGATLSSVAGLGIVAVGAGGWMFESLRIYSEPALLGEQGYTLGPVFVGLAVLILLASPRRLGARRIDGSRARAMATMPVFRKRVRTELHGAELYRAHRFLPSVVVLGLLWLGTAVAFVAMFREEWADPQVTVLNGTWATVGVLAAGVLGVLMMVPGRSSHTVLVDDEGHFFTDGPVAAGMAAPAEAPQAVAAAGAPQAVAAPAVVADVAPGSPPPAGRAADGTGRGRMIVGALVGALVMVLVLVGAVAFYALRSGEARSPSEVADLFGQAKVTCLDFDVISDTRATKTLGCRTDDVQIITVTTYGDRPAPEQWLSEWCESSDGSAGRLRRGYYLVGDDFILDMHQLKPPKFVKPTPIERTSTRLARVLDASVIPYDCTTR